ncbi:MAG: thioredoxin family protein, partial [Proteobacteria bacterium]|nr:thioredoxin family protein [Pseudomonadota bacterium]
PGVATPGAPIQLAVAASWLVCSDICVPENADLNLSLPVGNGALDVGAAPLFAAARAELPRPAAGTVSAATSAQELVLTLNPDWGHALASASSVSFFPFAEGSIEYGAPQRLSRDAGGARLAMKLGYAPPRQGPVEGVLVLEQGSGVTAQNLAMNIAAPLLASSAAAATAPRFANAAPGAAISGGAVPSAAKHSPLALLLLAILGGLILNLMPCVFPVLSIKAIGLVEQSRKSPGAVRLKGLAFAAGVIASMLTLAAALLALRAGGQQVGWGFQLQSPVFVTLMAYLLLAVGLNLSGVFEFGGSLAGVGDKLTRGEGLSASFFTGVLTTLVATPCTAPYMAAAVGAALTQSATMALAIFTALGLGLSLPYLLLSFAPVLRRVLPKPGAWMDTLKQVFAFPMYASCAWLVWVLAQQVSSVGLGAALTGLVLIAFAAWSLQKSHACLGRSKALTLLVALAALGLALFLPSLLAPAGAAARGRTGGEAAAADGWRPYQDAALQSLVAEGKPVLVNFTAAWCLTCLVNERNAFADPAVEEVFRRKGVVLMKGDWTNREPAITQALARFGRAGVPLYVVYNADPVHLEPRVLPQLLSADLVRNTFAKLPDR